MKSYYDYEPGFIVGKYRIQSHLASGGMSTVYLARQIEGIERTVALKIINSRLIDKENIETYIRRFRQEANVLADFNHPNIAKVFDYGEHEGRVYLVMEYYTGGTLQKMIETANKAGAILPLDTIARLVNQIGSALMYAHTQKVIHRDLKPLNILIHENSAVLSDFGIVKLLESDATSLTHNDMRPGTVGYMAPEQLNGDKVDGRTDEYSLAIMIYQMLTGHRPFEGDTAAIIRQHLRTPPPDIRERRSDLPPKLKLVLDKALEKDPHKRYADIQHFLNSFNAALAVDTASKPTWQKYAPFLAGGLIILCVAGLVLSSLSNMRSTLMPSLQTDSLTAPTSLVQTGILDRTGTGLSSATNRPLPIDATNSGVVSVQSLTLTPQETALNMLFNTLTANPTENVVALPTAITSTLTASVSTTATDAATEIPPRSGQSGKAGNDSQIEMVWASFGTFQSYINNVSYCIPQGFWIDRAEVTYQQYMRFIDGGGYADARYWSAQGWEWLRLNHSSVERKLQDFRDRIGSGGSLEPVTQITWYEGNAYAHWRGGRLPTAIEWEYAAGGGQRTQRQTLRFPWGPTFDASKASLGSTRRDPVIAGTYNAQAGFLDLYDMIGNVGEWVALPEDVESATGPNPNDLRPVMGGWWTSPVTSTSAASQDMIKVSNQIRQVGLRIIVLQGDRHSCP